MIEHDVKAILQSGLFYRFRKKPGNGSLWRTDRVKFTEFLQSVSVEFSSIAFVFSYTKYTLIDISNVVNKNHTQLI